MLEENMQGPHRTPPPALWGNSVEHHKTSVIYSLQTLVGNTQGTFCTEDGN